MYNDTGTRQRDSTVNAENHWELILKIAFLPITEESYCLLHSGQAATTGFTLEFDGQHPIGQTV